MAIRLEAQLDGSLRESVDCGPSTVVMALDYTSGGSLRPTTERVRAKMNDQDTTNPQDWERAIRGFEPELAKRGLRVPFMRQVTSDTPSDLWDILYKRKRPVLMVIDYGTVKMEGRWWWSSTSFTGLHAVLYRVGRIKDGERQVKVFDPLADGRTINGRKMRKGPNWWPWRVAKAAATGTVSPGRVRGLVISKAKPIADPTPPDETEPEPDEREQMGDAIIDAWEALERATEAVADARVSLREYVPADSDSQSDGEQGVAP